MAVIISRPCYSSRDEVMRSVDFKFSELLVAATDRAMMSAADNIEGQLHRHFYPWDGTLRLDWPNYQWAYPWRYWLNRHDLVVLTSLQSPAGSAIPLYAVLLYAGMSGPWPGFPYTRVELDRSQNVSWGLAATPQRSIVMEGTWGFTADADQVAALADSIGTGDTTITVTDGSQCGPGDVLVIGYARGDAPYPSYAGTAGAIQPYAGERVIVTDKATAVTGLTQSSGCTTVVDSDNVLTATGSGTIYPGEVLLLDSEQMLAEQVIPSGSIVVQRGWNGTVVATHSGATVYAYRLLTVIRGELGTAAASADSAAGVWRHRVPQLVRDLAIAEAANQVLQELSGYSRTVGSGDAAMPASGVSLADKWDEVVTRFGRKARKGTI
jgi:hypothetical protein